MININGAQVNQDFNPNKKGSEFFGEQVTSFVAVGENMKFEEWNLMKSFFTENQDFSLVRPKQVIDMKRHVYNYYHPSVSWGISPKKLYLWENP